MNECPSPGSIGLSFFFDFRKLGLGVKLGFLFAEACLSVGFNIMY
jgi:hypothetical protein